MSRAHELLARAARHLEAWHESYGSADPVWLPPAGDVRLLEDIGAELRAAPAPAEREVVTPIGRTACRPAELVPLANGRSADLGGRWTMPT